VDSAVVSISNEGERTYCKHLLVRTAYNHYATLASIHARTTVISGGADPLTPPSHAADMTAAIRGAEHVHVPCAGHMLPQQVPHVINEAIRRTIAVGSSSDTIRPRRLGRAG
jgi:pimeloyl-ACP methyl ester carboxylesterase